MSELTKSQRDGGLLALFAFVFWGIIPLYFKLLAAVPAVEIVCHRVIWSFVFTGVLIVVLRKLPQLQALLRDRRKFAVLGLSATMVSFNWLIFIWSVTHHHMLDASLGYFINPLFNMVLGFVFLRERMNGLQTMAALLATVGVAINVWAFGSVPWIALSLAISFGFYGLIRKQVQVDALLGMVIETAYLLPLALAYLLLVSDSSTARLLGNGLHLDLLLMAAGPATTLPLMAFAAAATRLQLTTLGFFQYLGPSLMFLLAILAFGESVGPGKWITFICIWTALGLFTLNAVLTQRRSLPLAVAP